LMPPVLGQALAEESPLIRVRIATPAEETA
jgi:hypothetical protein